MQPIFPGYTPLPEQYTDRPRYYFCNDTYMAAWLLINGHEVQRITVAPDTMQCTLWFAAGPEVNRLVKALRDDAAIGSINAYRRAHKDLYRMVGEARRDARDVRATQEAHAARQSQDASETEVR